MNAKEVCEYVTDLEKKYHEACIDRQGALEILLDILCHGAAVQGETRGVPENRIANWIDKVPHMSSDRCVKTVLSASEEV